MVLLATAYAVAPQMSRMEEMNSKVQKVLASAQTDENGLVAPTEYGRLLNEVIANVGRLKYLEDYPGIIDDYVKTLSGPKDPKKLLDDFITGDLSRIIMDPVSMRRRIKRDL